MFKWLGNLMDSNEKALKKLQPIVDKINALEPEYTKFTDEELKAKTPEFKDLLVKAVAVGRKPGGHRPAGITGRQKTRGGSPG